MSEPAYLFDTGALIDIYLGRERIRPYFESLVARRAYVSAISEAELWRGLRSGEEERHEALLAYFTAQPVTSSAARLAGRWMRQHASRGLGWMDAFIVAAAVAADATILTRDRKLAETLAGEAPFECYG